ncbi:MAG: hypothetical protein ACLUD2_14895 [Clostridium sp.]
MSRKPSAATSQETAPAAGICLISAGPCSVLADICIPEHITLIETSLPVLELYNRVHEYLHRFRVWDTGLQRIVDTNAGLQALLEQAYKELPATILLVNAGYKKIAAVYDPHIQDSTADELRENGYQSFDTIQSIHHQQVVKRGENMEYAEYISDLSHNYTIVRLIHYRGELVARLCVILDGPATDPCISDFNELLSRYVADYMLSNHRTDYSGKCPVRRACRRSDRVPHRQRRRAAAASQADQTGHETLLPRYADQFPIGHRTQQKYSIGTTSSISWNTCFRSATLPLIKAKFCF